ncbi:MAG: hypothetical protein ACYS17_01985 [Planctomycetota bacterium]|jgi:hypothetical protein
MKRVINIWLVAAILFTMPVIAQADSPFVNISPSSESLKFGKPVYTLEGSHIGPGAVLYPTTFGTASAALTLKVESNCLHGPIMAEITKLRHRMGKTIKPDRVSIKSPITNGFVSMEQPVVISNPEMGSHEIDLSFRLDITTFEAAGQYKGILTFTVMPLP